MTAGAIYVLIAGLLVLFLARCARHQPRFNAAAEVEPEPVAWPQAELQGDSFVWVAFSGGGTRAAALAWSVLECLRRIPFPSSRDGGSRVSTLADEIDVISGISGGSFAAAAWCLARNDPERFREGFLERDLERAIRWDLAGPRLGHLLSPRYNRINVAAELYDREIFRRATFGDLPPRPRLAVHATHLSLGARFSFTPEDFRRIGSDLDSYPIGYACAASSAFPVLLSPMTLINHGETLTLEELSRRDRHSYRKLVRNAFNDVETDLRRVAHEYYNDKRNRFIHLADGGLVDNQGLQAVIDSFLTGGLINQRMNHRERPLKRLVIINVNAGTRPYDESGKSPRAPGLLEVMKYTMVSSMDVLSAKRWIRVRDLCVDRYQRSRDARQDQPYRGMEPPYAVEVSLRRVPDPDLRERCYAIPTRFRLSAEELDRLDSVAPDLLRGDPQMRKLGQSLAAELADEPAALARLDSFFGPLESG